MQTHNPSSWPGLVRQIGKWVTRKQHHEYYPTYQDRRKIINGYEDLFKINHTIKDLTISMQLKSNSKPIQQKGRPVLIHFQKIVRQILEKLFEKRRLEKADKTTETCFKSPADITIKKDELETSRERPKSAPYLRLKNSKRISKCQVFSSTEPAWGKILKNPIFLNFFRIFLVSG